MVCGTVLALFEGEGAYGLTSRFKQATGESVVETIQHRQSLDARHRRFLADHLDPADDPAPPGTDLY